MPRTLAVVANLSHFNMLNQYRYDAGQFSATFAEFVFSGSDVKSFLQSQSTYDINLLVEKHFQLISFLDPQGRVEFYGWLLFKDKNYTLLTPPILSDRALTRLNKYLISEDVTIDGPVLTSFYFLLGPEASTYADTSALEGILFDEPCYLQKTNSDQVKIVSEDEKVIWQALSGWPALDGSDCEFTLINNLRLFDLSLIQNKGCYPGQETVSKIATRRGAAYSPVLVEVSKKASAGDLYVFDKKIGNCSGCYEWGEKFYLTTSLLRDFRVEKMKLHFILNESEYEGKVCYFPLLSGNKTHKAQELFYLASDYFKYEALEEAEASFKLAIKLDPEFGDAYESLGVMLGRLNRYEEAIELMKQLSTVDTKSVLAHTNMSLFLMKMGKISEAEEQKSIATIKSFQSFGDEAKSKELEDLRKKNQEKEWNQREAMFHQVLEIDPDDTLANYGIGSIAVEKGDWERARQHLEKVLEQDAKYSVAYLALGKALKGLGLNEEARKIWQEGIKVSAAKGDLMPANQMQQELSS
jgi:tetratricopeptide (TPR) repeat protein